MDREILPRQFLDYKENIIWKLVHVVGTVVEMLHSKQKRVITFVNITHHYIHDLFYGYGVSYLAVRVFDTIKVYLIQLAVVCDNVRWVRVLPASFWNHNMNKDNHKSDSGKGDMPRPMFISREEYQLRWKLAFGCIDKYEFERQWKEIKNAKEK